MWVHRWSGRVQRGGTTTTLGGIGTGYIYADWKGQVAYTTPNMNGFSATLGITQPWNAVGDTAGLVSASFNWYI